jgi:hypothetical protein
VFLVGMEEGSSRTCAVQDLGQMEEERRLLCGDDPGAQPKVLTWARALHEIAGSPFQPISSEIPRSA